MILLFRSARVHPQFFPLGGERKVYTKKKQHQWSQLALRELERYGYKALSTYDYNKMMTLRAQSLDVDGIKNIMTEMKSKGVEPCTVSYNILLDTYCKLHQADNAKAVLNEMKEKNIPINAITYGSFFGMYAKLNQPESIIELVNEMKQLGMEQTDVNDSTLIGAYAKLFYVDEAFEVLERMKRKENRDLEFGYFYVINMLCKLKKADAVIKVYEDLKDRKVLPRIETLNAMIDSFAKLDPPRMDFIERMFEEMKNYGYEANEFTYSSLTTHYLHTKQYEKVYEIVKIMKENKIPLRTVLYQIFFSYQKLRDVKTAFEIVEEMKKNGVQINAIVYNGMLGLIEITTGKFNFEQKEKKMFEIMKDMKNDGIEINSYGYRAIIALYVFANKKKEAMKYYDECLKHNNLLPIPKIEQLIRRLNPDKEEMK